MNRPVRIVLIGAGAIAQAYLQAVRELKEATLVAVVDPREEARRAAAECVNGPGFENHHALEGRVEFDAAVICTPPSTHPEIGVSLLKQGVSVLCEKPLAVNLAGARKLVKAAESSGALFTMASKFRYTLDVVRARSMIQSGLVGEVLLVENAFTGRIDMTRRWNSDPEISGGGVLIDNGTHSVDIVRYCIGPITSVHAVEGKRMQDIEVEDTAHLFLATENGARANVDLSWSLHKDQAHYLAIHGTAGTIEVGWKRSRYRQASANDWVTFGTGYDKLEAFRHQLKNFSRAVQGHEPLRITADDALASVRVIEAAYKSLAGSEWVNVPAESGKARTRKSTTEVEV